MITETVEQEGSLGGDIHPIQRHKSWSSQEYSSQEESLDDKVKEFNR